MALAVLLFNVKVLAGDAICYPEMLCYSGVVDYVYASDTRRHDLKVRFAFRNI
ncbi:MAG: hypothetical protein ABSA78_17165 [Candidatus Sulfotelmatobacter sp.]|jgi:hypothetical protein